MAYEERDILQLARALLWHGWRIFLSGVLCALLVLGVAAMEAEAEEKNEE